MHSSVRHKRRLRQTRFCECEGDTVDKSRFAVFFSSWLLLEPGGGGVGGSLVGRGRAGAVGGLLLWREVADGMATSDAIFV